MKSLRARLLRYIVKTRFEESFGEEWWNVLLDHMREEAMRSESVSGKKYAVALKKYGRSIQLDDLDTTVLCEVILWDKYFQEDAHKVTYGDNEVYLVRQLHAYRNRISHEEGSSGTLSDPERETLKLLRQAVDELNLMEKDIGLAMDILRAYAEYFGFTGNGDLLQKTARFEEAEDLFRWEIDKAIPIYEELAEDGFIEAQKKLLFIYTKTSNKFDLDKAFDVLCRHPDILEESKKNLLRAINRNIPQVIWGTPSICGQMLQELKAGDLIRNASMEQYILWIREAFPNGLLDLIPLNRDPAFNTNSAQISISPAQKANTAEETDVGIQETLETECRKALIALAETNRSFSTKQTAETITKIARMGYLPAIEYFAGKEAANNKNNLRAKQNEWIRYGAKRGSRKCSQWLEECRETKAPAHSDVAADSDRKENQFREMRSELSSLQEENKKLKKELYAALGAAALLLVAVITLLL